VYLLLTKTVTAIYIFTAKEQVLEAGWWALGTLWHHKDWEQRKQNDERIRSLGKKGQRP